MENWVANPNLTNYKAVYDKYETYVVREIEGVYVTQAMNDLVDFWKQGALEPKDHETFFVTVALPKIATKMVRTRYISEPLTHSIYSFIQRALQIAIELMPQNITAYADFLTYAMDHSCAFYSSKKMPAHLAVKFASPPNSPPPEANEAEQQNNTTEQTPEDAKNEQTFGSENVGSPNKSQQSPAMEKNNASVLQALAAQNEHLKDLPFDDEPSDAHPYASLYQSTAHYPSEYFPNLLNYFGVIGGFRSMFYQMSLETTPIVIISQFLYALRNAASLGFMFPRRLKQFTPKVLQMSPLVRQLSPTQLKQTKKEDLEALLRNLGGFLKLTMPGEIVADQMDQFGLRIAAQCLTSGILTQRIFAINFLGSAIDAVLPKDSKSQPEPVSETKWLNIPNLIDWIRSSQILHHLFGDSSHNQLLKNSSKLMKFLAQFDGLTTQDVELIWKCGTTSHESLALDALAVFFEISPYLSPKLVEPIISSLHQLTHSPIPEPSEVDNDSAHNPPHELDCKDIQNIATLANRLGEDSQRLQLVQMLLDVFEMASPHLINDVIYQLQDIFRTEWYRRHRLPITMKLLKELKNDHNPNKAYCCTLLDTLFRTWTHDDPSKQDSFMYITTQLRSPLEDYLIDELLHYKEQCKPFVTPETYSQAFSELQLYGSTAYSHQIQCRLYLLYYVFVNGQAQLSRESVLKLWDCLYNGALCYGEVEECFEWFKAAASDGSIAITPILADHLFQSRLMHLDFQHLSPGGYYCFERYFIHSNMVLQQISYVAPPNNQQQSEYDFVVQTQPEGLIGEPCLWDIALTNQDPSVVQKCLQMLIKCMEQIDPALQLEISPVQLREHFIAKCLGRLSTWVAQYQGTEQAEDGVDQKQLEKNISGCLSLLVSLMDTLEPAASKRATMTRGLPMHIKIRAFLEVPSSVNPGNIVRVDFMLPCESTTSFSSLQSQVLSSLQPQLIEHNISADELIYIQTYPWYRRLDNEIGVADASLQALEFYDRDCIDVIHLPSTKGLETVLRARKGQTFNKYQEKQRPQDAEARIQQICEFAEWSVELAEFALKTHSWDVEQVGNAIMDESRRHKLLNEAKKAGIGKQTQEQSDQPSSREIVSIMKQRTKSILSIADDFQATDMSLPSVILSTNKSHFDALFSLLTLNNDKISAAVWEIILRIPTSSSIKAAILASPEPDWAALLPLDVYRLYYTIQIIDQVLCPLDDSWAVSKRLDWVTRFESSGGVQQLFNIVANFDAHSLTPSENEQHASSQDESSPTTELDLRTQTRRDCLAIVLKILDVFLTAYNSASACTTEQEDLVELSPEIIENVEDDRQKPKLSNERKPSLSTVYRNKINCRSALLLPVDISATLSHLEDILSWSCRTNPPVANGPLIGYAWRCFVNISLAAKKNQSISQQLSKRQASQDESEEDSSPIVTKKLMTLAMDLLLDLNPDIRRETSTTLFDLALQHTESADLLLKSLLHNLPSEKTLIEADLELSLLHDRFYWLLELLVKLKLNRLEQNEPGSLFAYSVTELFSPHLTYFMNAIQIRPSSEHGMHSHPDWILNGSFRILTSILKAWPNDLVCSELITELYQRCMFTDKYSSTKLPKCKTHTTRSSAYELFLVLAKLSTENKQQILTLFSGNHSGPYQKISQWEYYPGNEDKSSAGYVGLVNLGATCYMNSLIQQFYMMPSLRRDLLAAPVVLGPTDTLKENMVYQFHHLLGNLQESEKAAYNPREFTGSYRDIEGNPADVNMQQDVSEFFNIVCASLENQLKGTSDEKLLQRNFGCTQVSQIKSMEPEFPYVSQKEEELYAIPLDVRLKNNFYDAMDLFVKQDMLEGDNKYNCEKYQRHIVASKGNLIKTMSNTLIFHLMRFDFDVATYRKRKLNEYFSFPMRMNMQKWTMAGQDPNEEKLPDSYYDYQLTGVLVHTGSADSGHYYSLIKEREPPHKWYQFNDRVVSEFDPNSIGSECFGGYHTVKEWDQRAQKEVYHEVPTERSAYMLFYERVVPIPPPEKPQEVVQPNRKVLRSASYINGVPSEVHNKIWEENSTFLKERQIFDPAYFHFMKRFVSQFSFDPILHVPSDYEEDIASDIIIFDPETHSIPRPEMSALKIAVRLTVELIAHAKDNHILTSMLSMLAQVLSDHVPACIWFVEYVRKYNLIKELLLQCSVERTRIAFAHFLVQILQNLASNKVVYQPAILVKGSSSPVQGPVLPLPADQVLMTAVLDLLEESRGAWRRFKQYFMVIRDYCLIGTAQRQFMLKKGVISLYVDYFMGQSSSGVSRVRVMDEDNFPDLVEFIDTITVLVCSCKNENPSSDLIVDDPSNDSTVLSGPPRSRLQIDDLEMPAASKQDLYYATDFFTSLLEMDYNSPSTADMIEYISWYVPARTDYVLDHLLTKIDVKPTENKAPVLEYLLFRLLSIEDNLQNHRIERVMSKNEFASSLSKHHGSKMVKGLLLLAQSQHSPSVALLYMVGYMRLLEAHEPCREYILKHPVDLLWIRKFWKNQFEAQFTNIQYDKTILEDANNQLHRYFSAVAESVHPRHPHHGLPSTAEPLDPETSSRYEPWRLSVPYLGLVFATWLLQCTGDSEPAYEDIVLSQEKQLAQLQAKVAKLEKERKTLAKALLFVHDKYPNSKLDPKLQDKVEDIIRMIPISSSKINSNANQKAISSPSSYMSALMSNSGSNSSGSNSMLVDSTKSKMQVEDQGNIQTYPPSDVSPTQRELPKPPSASNSPQQKKHQQTDAEQADDKEDIEFGPHRDSSGSHPLASSSPKSSGEFDDEFENISLIGTGSWTKSDLAAVGVYNVLSRGNLIKEEDDDEDEDVTMFHAPHNYWSSAMRMGPSMPDDWEDRVNNLKMIGVEQSDEILKLLLEENNWSVENAANDLFDPDTIQRLRRKARDREQAQHASSKMDQESDTQTLDDGEIIIHNSAEQPRL